ncbi:MAG: nuclear transport factor 2 family protein [Acidimicrobiia bacterium]|nr:nuclear transport factor 2 family protein [Acidimicrobiia bacterium]
MSDSVSDSAPDSAVDPVTLVQTFLRLMEARDLDAAGRRLADGVTITFPGGRTFANLADQVASSAGRFRDVTKTFDQYDVIERADCDEYVVYVSGTLAGTALDGKAFDGVRYIDRFEIRDGLIVDQRVWNDLAESGVLTATDGAR